MARKIGLGIGIPVAGILAVVILFPAVIENPMQAPLAINNQVQDSLAAASDAIIETPEEKERALRLDERQIAELVSQERIDRGLNNLRYDEKLSEVGREHSDWMAATGTFEHSGNQYYHCMGENIAMQTRGPMTPKEVVDLWMDSSGHRAAILWRTHVAVGAGIAEADNVDFYYTLIMKGC